MAITISVIMAVYNTPIEYLEESIQSVLNQTYKDFEFIIVNDYSDEKTTNYLMSITEHRIKLIHNQENLGLTKSLNIALKNAKGKYIARMDSDDIAHPNRLETQLFYIQNHPEFVAIGSSFIVSNTNKVVHKKNIDKETRRTQLLFFNQGLCHPTAFINKSFLDKHHIQYREDLKKAQDYGLWVDILKYGDIGNIDVPLLTYRIHDNQISSNFSNQMSYEQITMKRQLDYLKVQYTEAELSAFYHLHRGEITKNEKDVLSILNKILLSNKKENIYNQKILNKTIQYVLLKGSLKQIKKYKRFKLLWFYIVYWGG